MRRALAARAASRARLEADTHRFVPERFYNTFSFAHPPALRIKPGDRVITRTIDAGGVDWDGKTRAQGPNPQTGPFFVEGAEPGDVLVVTIEKIETNRTTAYSSSLLAPYAADPAAIADAAGSRAAPRELADRQGRGHGDARRSRHPPAPSTLPLRPMLGCVGVAPARKEAIATSTPGAFGGNMDYAGLTAGVKVMLPVNEPGALLFIGDGHARQGEGEVVGTGLETSMDVEFTVELVKAKTIGWPRLENDTHLMVLGSARPLLQALQHANSEMQRWLMADYGFSERGAAGVHGAGARDTRSPTWWIPISPSWPRSARTYCRRGSRRHVRPRSRHRRPERHGGPRAGAGRIAAARAVAHRCARHGGQRSAPGSGRATDGARRRAAGAAAGRQHPRWRRHRAGGAAGAAASRQAGVHRGTGRRRAGCAPGPGASASTSTASAAGPPPQSACCRSVRPGWRR